MLPSYLTLRKLQALAQRSAWFFFATSLLACSSANDKPQSKQAPRNFTGSWEMNYGRSETANAKIQALYRALQREAERQARRPSRDPFGRPTISVGAGSADSIRSLIPLARMAESITTSSVVEIEQDPQRVSMSRNDNFTLECDFFKPEPAEEDINPLGTERCGWDGQDLIFQIDLPESLDIIHRLTLAPDKQELRIATTVSSGNRQFTLNKYFYRFEPIAPNYDCQFTLSRGNVCSRSGQ